MRHRLTAAANRASARLDLRGASLEDHLVWIQNDLPRRRELSRLSVYAARSDDGDVPVMGHDFLNAEHDNDLVADIELLPVPVLRHVSRVVLGNYLEVADTRRLDFLVVRAVLRVPRPLSNRHVDEPPLAVHILCEGAVQMEPLSDKDCCREAFPNEVMLHLVIDRARDYARDLFFRVGTVGFRSFVLRAPLVRADEHGKADSSRGSEDYLMLRRRRFDGFLLVARIVLPCAEREPYEIRKEAIKSAS